MNPIQQTPPKNPDVEETTGPDDPLDALLTQIINGFFVLTDGQGAVSKWSEPAELLFGLDAAEVLGKGLFDTLVDHAPPDAESWRRFLENGEAPRTRAQQSVSGIYAADKRSFPLDMVFIPVKLDEGFDFSLFLEDLAFELPRNLMLMRMRQQHPVVVRALRQALETEPQPWDGWRTAGTLVAFRPLEATPWVEEALAAREAARSEQDTEVEERLDPDPGIQGDSIADLDDAAAVVARLLSALERIEDLEKTAADLPVALEEARREAQASRDRAEQAERNVNEAREQLERVRDEIRPAEDPEEAAALRERIARLEETPA
ncbi:MAG: PAS domain-containing protein, partial [Actinomycetota bacterium]|nr:PAS domain-containing protein [Actinomycetota bacterium]